MITNYQMKIQQKDLKIPYTELEILILGCCVLTPQK